MILFSSFMKSSNLPFEGQLYKISGARLLGTAGGNNGKEAHMYNS
jgi:hypothetical protein